jgi:ABC-type lipoprotein export system ATPase subunit
LNDAGAHELEACEVSCASDGGGELRAISATFVRGRLHVLRGTTGDGRDLLLRVLGLLHPPDGGEVLVRGSATRELTENARAALRTQRFGFVFAAPFLLSSFSVIENVAMPLFKISHVSSEEARRRTEVLLEFVGLADAAERVVDDLEIPDQYRTALARGLINEPSCLIVENLDGALTGEELLLFLDMLRRACETFGTTVIASASATVPLIGGERVLDIVEGRIVADSELLPESGS